MRVEVRNGNIGKAFSIFKRKHSDKLLEARERQRYEKPSDKRRKAKRVAAIREAHRQRGSHPTRA
jgi:ribosomal protein S21